MTISCGWLLVGLDTITELLGLIMECCASIGRNVLGGGLDCNHNHLLSQGYVTFTLIFHKNQF